MGMATTSEGPAGADLLWGDASPTPARPALSLERIAEAACTIADADSIEAVSMQRVAGELGFTKMSLYRYVSSKSELIAVMIDRAVGEPPNIGDMPGTWRDRAEEFTKQLGNVWEQHQWLPSVTTGDRLMGPREVGWTDSAVAIFDGTGLSGSERLDAAFLIFGHMRNTHSRQSGGTQAWNSEHQFSSKAAELIRRHRDRVPALYSAVESATTGPGDNGRQFGLERILDGLAALIDRRPNQAT
jgi:AcrR family transcriptional regulator